MDISTYTLTIVGETPPQKGAGSSQRPPKRGGRCYVSSAGRSLLIYPSGKGWRLDAIGKRSHYVNMTTKRTTGIRVSERARRLARAIDPEASQGRSVEFALEFMLALKLWEVDANALRVGGEAIRADGPLSGDAATRLQAHQAVIVDRILERAIRSGVESYRAEKHFAERQAAE